MRLVPLVLAALVLLPAAAEAQWVMLARRAIGRIQQVQQMPPNQDVGADVASVAIRVPAQRVYAQVLATIRGNPGLRLLSQDDANARLEVSNGDRDATVTVTPLGDALSQLLVGSTFRRGEAPEASRVVAHILQVCGQLKVACSVR